MVRIQRRDDNESSFLIAYQKFRHCFLSLIGHHRRIIPIVFFLFLIEQKRSYLLSARKSYLQREMAIDEVKTKKLRSHSCK